MDHVYSMYIAEVSATIGTWELLDLNQSKAIQLTGTSLFPMKKELLRWDSNPRHTAYEADALPTELPRQLSWLGQIKAVQGKGNQSNLT